MPFLTPGCTGITSVWTVTTWPLSHWSSAFKRMFLCHLVVRANIQQCWAKDWPLQTQLLMKTCTSVYLSAGLVFSLSAAASISKLRADIGSPRLPLLLFLCRLILFFIAFFNIYIYIYIFKKMLFFFLYPDKTMLFFPLVSVQQWLSEHPLTHPWMIPRLSALFAWLDDFPACCWARVNLFHVILL